jgi:hypothetical protein
MMLRCLMDEGFAVVLALCAVVCVALFIFVVGLSCGAHRAETRLCEATCGEHWALEPGGPCVCLEVSDV